MKSWNYWQQFMNTGSVRDYLEYVQVRDGCKELKQEEAGVRQDAGIYICNRDHTETDACR